MEGVDSDGCLVWNCKLKHAHTHTHTHTHTNAHPLTHTQTCVKVLNSSSVCELTSSKIKFQEAEEEQQRKFALTI